MDEQAQLVFERVWFGGSRPTYADLLKGIKLPEKEEPYEVFMRTPVGPGCHALLMFSGDPSLEDIRQLERFLGIYKESIERGEFYDTKQEEAPTPDEAG